jgi:hypothetical protein
LGPSDLDSSKPPCIRNIHKNKCVHEVRSAIRTFENGQYQPLGCGKLIRIDRLVNQSCGHRTEMCPECRLSRPRQSSAWHMHQVHRANQSADQDREPNRVKSERNSISVSIQPWQFSQERTCSPCRRATRNADALRPLARINSAVLH